MRTLKGLLIFAWFFGFRFPLGDSATSKVSALVGPFSSKTACETAYDDAGGMLDIPGIVLSRCVEIKDA